MRCQASQDEEPQPAISYDRRLRLEPLYRVEFAYPEGWSVELAGEHGGEWQDVDLAEGSCSGSLKG